MGTIGPGAFLCTLGDSEAVGMSYVAVVVAFVVVKTSVRFNKASIWISFCGRYTQNAFYRPFMDITTASAGVTVD